MWEWSPRWIRKGSIGNTRGGSDLVSTCTWKKRVVGHTHWLGPACQLVAFISASRIMEGISWQPFLSLNNDPECLSSWDKIHPGVVFASTGRFRSHTVVRIIEASCSLTEQRGENNENKVWRLNVLPYYRQLIARIDEEESIYLWSKQTRLCPRSLEK